MLYELVTSPFRWNVTGLVAHCAGRVASELARYGGGIATVVYSAHLLLGYSALFLTLGGAARRLAIRNPTPATTPSVTEDNMDSPAPSSPSLPVEIYGWVAKAEQHLLDAEILPPALELNRPLSSSSASSSLVCSDSSSSLNHTFSPGPSSTHTGSSTPQHKSRVVAPPRLFDCGICQESFTAPEVIALSNCDHPFCYDCLRTHTETKLREGRFPILCPLCSLDRSLVRPTQIDQAVLDVLQVSKSNFDRFVELEMMEIAISVRCPKCKKTMFVDRKEFSDATLVTCPLPACRHRWCKQCNKNIPEPTSKHRCKDQKLNRVMKKKGWKFCPGCLSPVEKTAGCDHITCRAPGCNVHFCYQCGDTIIDTSNGGDVGRAVTAHGSECRAKKPKGRFRGRSCVVQ